MIMLDGSRRRQATREERLGLHVGSDRRGNVVREGSNTESCVKLR